MEIFKLFKKKKHKFRTPQLEEKAKQKERMKNNNYSPEELTALASVGLLPQELEK